MGGLGCTICKLLPLRGYVALEFMPQLLQDEVQAQRRGFAVAHKLSKPTFCTCGRLGPASRNLLDARSDPPVALMTARLHLMFYAVRWRRRGGVISHSSCAGCAATK